MWLVTAGGRRSAEAKFAASAPKPWWRIRVAECCLGWEESTVRVAQREAEAAAIVTSRVGLGRLRGGGYSRSKRSVGVMLMIDQS